MESRWSWSKKSRWVKNGFPTPDADKLLFSVETRLKARGREPKAVIAVTKELQKSDPAYEGYEPETLVRAYYHVRSLPPRPITEKDRWMSSLQRWGVPPETSRTLLDRLIKIVTIKMPVLGLPYIDLMFDRVTRVRRLRTAQSKVESLERSVEDLESGRLPIRPWDQASNRNIELIKAALGDALERVGDIAARTGIKPRTTQDLLVFMVGTGDAVREKHGRYRPPQKGAAAYVRPGKMILKELERGPGSPAELQERTGLTEVQVTGALHWLWRRAGKIDRPRPNFYALPGTVSAAPHIYAHDAFVLALVSGEKSMPELAEITGKNRPELWAAFRRRLSPDGIVKRIGFRSRSDVRPGLRGRVAVFALTAKGRRRAKLAV